MTCGTVGFVRGLTHQFTTQRFIILHLKNVANQFSNFLMSVDMMEMSEKCSISIVGEKEIYNGISEIRRSIPSKWEA